MTLTPVVSESSNLETQALFEEARRRRRHRRMTAGATIAVVVALVAGLLFLVSNSSRGGRGVASSTRPNGVGTFTHPTGDVLVFADGLTLDLDHRTAVARAIPGQRGGDQQWDIIRSGDSFVVGWGEVWASPIAGGSSRLLGPVVTFVPAAEAGAVWLVDYPGGRIGEGTPTLREVTVTGSVLRTEVGPPVSSGVPIVGTPGDWRFRPALASPCGMPIATRSLVDSAARLALSAIPPRVPSPGAKAAVHRCMSPPSLAPTMSSRPRNGARSWSRALFA